MFFSVLKRFSGPQLTLKAKRLKKKGYIDKYAFELIVIDVPYPSIVVVIIPSC